MAIKYNKLFSLLALREQKKTDLLEYISAPTLAKLSKAEPVSSVIINTLCAALSCQPADLMEYVPHPDDLKPRKSKPKPAPDPVPELPYDVPELL